MDVATAVTAATHAAACVVVLLSTGVPERSRRSLAAFFAALAIMDGVGILRVTAPLGTRLYEVLAFGMLVASAVAITQFRASVLRPGLRLERLVAGTLVACISAVVIVELRGMTPIAERRSPAIWAGALALAAWVGALAEVAVLLLRRSSRHGLRVQRIRQTLLGIGIAGLAVGVTLRGAGWYVADDGLRLVGQVGTVGAALLIVVGMVPPKWLRAAWRRPDDEKASQGNRLLAGYSEAPETLALRALDRAMAMTDARVGILLDEEGRELAARRDSEEIDGERLFELVPQREVSVVIDDDIETLLWVPVPRMSGTGGLLLVGDHFSPVLGDDELRAMEDYGLLVGVALDRVTSTAAQRAERDRYQQLVGGLGELNLGVARVDDFRLVYANEALERMVPFGWTDHAAMGADIRSFLPADDLAYVREQLNDVRSPETVRFVHLRTRPDGSEGVYLVAMAVEAPGTAVSVVLDVTDEVRTRRALEQREHALSEAQRIGQMGSWSWHLVRQAVEWSPELYRLFGEDPESFEPTSDALMERVHPEDRDIVVDAIDRAMSTGQSWKVRHRIRRSDGAVRVLESRGRVGARGRDGEVTQLTGVARDVTTEEQQLEALRRQRARLRALGQRLSAAQEEERRLIALRLHDDVGQIITGIELRLASHVAHCDGPDLEVVAAMLGDLHGRVRDLSSGLRPALLDDLGLRAAVSALADRVVDSFGYQLELRLDASADRRYRVEVETTAYRIVQEALTNVARHAGADRVVVEMIGRGDAVEVRVADDGRGFEPEAIPDAATGISGMSERAASLGGVVRVDSEPGAGTVVTALLPTGPADDVVVIPDRAAVGQT